MENDMAERPMLKLTIMRGLPGSGKSTLAHQQDGVVFSTDDYFVVNGKYTYSREHLVAAHEWNQWRCKVEMDKGKCNIIIDNTNLVPEHVVPYVLLAIANGYRIDILEPKGPYVRSPKHLVARCTHDVPLDRINEMNERWEDYTVMSLLSGLSDFSQPTEPVWLCRIFHQWGPWEKSASDSQFRVCSRCRKKEKGAE